MVSLDEVFELWGHFIQAGCCRARPWLFSVARSEGRAQICSIILITVIMLQRKWEIRDKSPPRDEFMCFYNKRHAI